MNKKLLAAGLLFCGLLSQAQHLNCGNPHEHYATEVQRLARLKSIMKNKVTNRQAAADGITYVAIKAHVFGEDDATDYTDSNAINIDIANLNRFFKPLNVQFYFSGTAFDYYPNSALNNYQLDSDADIFHGQHGVDNAINMYIAKSVYLDGNSAGGWSYVAPSQQPYNMMWLVGGQMAIYDGKTTGHEMGHYFGLLHTFNDSGNEDETLRELVTRNFNETAPRLSANCDTAGDYVCDTASDPYGLQGADVDDCVYTGEITDFNGDLFSPDIPNLMDYYWCMLGGFTQGQYERMQWGKEIVTNGDDFTLNAPETGQPAPTGVTAVNADNDYFGAVTVTWADNSQVETGFIIERATSLNGDFTAIGGVADNVTTYIDNTVEKATTYYYRVKASNTKDAYSGVSAGVVTPVICGNAQGQSCDLNGAKNEAAWYINSFSVQTAGDGFTNNNSGCSVNGIGNYYNTYSATITPGDAVSFTVQSKIDSGGGAYNIIANVYVDWNKNGDFNDVNELVYQGSELQYAEASGSFAVPQNIEQGGYRLRVVMTAANSVSGPCSVNFGEIEDYRLVYGNLSTELVSKNSFTVYPNPTQSTLNIKSPAGVQVAAVSVTDVTGKTVLTQNNADVVNVASLANGVYILTIKSDAGVTALKFIKN